MLRSRGGFVPRTVIASAVVFASGTTIAWAAGPSAPAAAARNADSLNGVVAISPADAWAVGSSQQPAGAVVTIAEQWKGGSWQVVPSPSPGGTGTRAISTLKAVAATSPADVWAVGSTTVSGHWRITHSLIEHWNGTSWRQVPSFSQGDFTELDAVTAISPTDAWAAGQTLVNNDSVALIEHWNGVSWRKVPSPAPAGSNLNGIAGTSPGSVWAVGGYFPRGLIVRTFAEHWNGRKWARVASADPAPAGRNNLFAVAVAAGSKPWTAGITNRLKTRTRTLTEHWNGRRWVRLPSPAPGPSPEDQLLGMAVASPASVFAVGYVEAGGALIEHWNGTKWTVQPNPDSAAKLSSLAAVSADSGSDAWAVGTFETKAGHLRTLIERWNGSTWQTVSSPSP